VAVAPSGPILRAVDADEFDIAGIVGAHDVPGRFESFTDEERATLRRYHVLCTELEESSFHNEPASMSMRETVQVRHAGFDSIRSMSMTFRQLWMQGEPARMQTVLSLLRRRAKPPDLDDDFDVISVLDELGRRFKEARREELMKHVWADDMFGEPKESFRAEGIIQDWFYSGRFHEDMDAAARVAGWSSEAYEWSLVKAFIHLTNVMCELHVLVAELLGDPRTGGAKA
jgi:hypothetical protein